MKKLLSFHGSKRLKAKYVKRMEEHARLDQIIQGTYWKNGKGCATGCLVHSKNPHKKYPTLLGIPEDIAYLEDRIFEGLSNGEAKDFAVNFLKVIPVGADLSKISIKMKIYILSDKHNGVIQYANEETKKIIKEIVRLQKLLIKGENVDKEMEAARSAAWSAWSAARSARSAESVAGSARSAAWSAESAAWSARSAAWSAESAAWSAGSADSADSAAYKNYAKHLLKLLKESK